MAEKTFAELKEEFLADQRRGSELWHKEKLMEFFDNFDTRLEDLDSRVTTLEP